MVEANGESAIIVPVTVPVAVNRLRDRMDPSAAQGVPAHVTLIYPFMPPDGLKDDVRRRIEQIIAAAKAGKHVFTEKPFTLTTESAGMPSSRARSTSWWQRA